MNKYTPVIGLEIHVELKTKNKMFCQCSADYFGKEPNTNTCPVCLGLPGALAVANKKAIEWCIKIGKALGCTINTVSRFDRKHYFYPDLPKGYQISQYDEPIAVNGKAGKFRIHRVHQEEDTGKLNHDGDDTLVDFNRSGVPLVEIVTEPDFENSDDVKKFLEELHTIIEYLEVSDADMEKGSMRLEPNISLRKEGEKSLPKYKVEVKNINSFNFVKKAILYEIKRQTEILDSGETPKQETRGFSEAKGITVSQRSKEEAHDYRYFPEPDIPPMHFSQEFINSIEVPELPTQKQLRLMQELGLREQDAFILTRSKSLSQEFEDFVSKHKERGVAQKIANLMINKNIRGNALEEALRPREMSDEGLPEALRKVLDANPQVVENYKKGKTNVVMFLVGQVMKEMQGKADPMKVKEELLKALK